MVDALPAPRVVGVDEYATKTYLDDRWSEGCTNAWKLWEEIVSLGYKGSYRRVRAYLHKKRTSPRPVTARPPSPRTVTGWLLRRPESLTELEQLQLKNVRTHSCPPQLAPRWLHRRSEQAPGPVHLLGQAYSHSVRGRPRVITEHGAL
ncbi:hypothetical protein [Streptomyces sp. NPDC048473]|uniref:hypothetical protein n=1 Tax=unclassified Streptomyces TaxID=2593676 RepID=UPI003720369A